MAGLPIPAPDGRALLWAMVSASLMIAHQVAAKTTRDALFLSVFDVSELPRVVIAGAFLSLAAVLTVSRLLARHGPAKVVPGVFTVSAGLFVAEWLVYGAGPRLAAVALYLHVAALGALLVSAFWSLVNERFDPHSARRRIARIVAAATLGGVLGGLLAETVSTLADVRSMLLALAALHAACALGVAAIAGTDPRGPGASATRVRPALHVLRGSPYLRKMGLLVALVAVSAGLLDYALKAEAALRFRDEDALVTFFAAFYAVTGALALALQGLVTGGLLRRFGIGITLALLPALLVVGGAAGAVAAGIWSVAALRGSHAILGHSLFRSAFELLYTPLAPESKRPVKTVVDVACDRVGDVVAGAILLLLLALLPVVPSAAVVALAALAAGLALYLVRRLYRGYVDQLALSLRTGALELEGEGVVDATTQKVLAELSAQSERRLLLDRVKALRRARAERRDDGLPERPAPERQTPGASPALRADAGHDRLARAVADLASGDVARAHAALGGEFMDVRLVPYVVPLLGVDALAEDARMELRWMVPHVLGQLTDALLDPDQPIRGRQRIPSVLEVCHNPRSVEGLVHGISDPEFNVRYASARALARMRARDPRLRVSRRTVFAAVRSEAAVDEETWDRRALDTGPGRERGPGAARAPRDSLSLEHVFTLLSLSLDRDALGLCLQAVTGTDRQLRGTALEYLENVLPEDVRRALWPRLGAAPRRGADRRATGAVVSELRRRAAGRSAR